jgi:hypothetical protein
MPTVDFHSQYPANTRQTEGTPVAEHISKDDSYDWNLRTTMTIKIKIKIAVFILLALVVARVLQTTPTRRSPQWASPSPVNTPASNAPENAKPRSGVTLAVLDALLANDNFVSELRVSFRSQTNRLRRYGKLQLMKSTG